MADDYQRFMRDLRRVGQQARKLARLAATAAAEAAYTEAVAHVPSESGWLGSTLRVTSGPNGGAALTVGDSDTPYLGVVEFGGSDRAAYPFFRRAVDGAGTRTFNRLLDRVHGDLMGRLAG